MDIRQRNTHIGQFADSAYTVHRYVGNTIKGMTAGLVLFYASMVLPNKELKEVGSYVGLAAMVSSFAVGNRKIYKELNRGQSILDSLNS